MSTSTNSTASPDRIADLQASLSEIRSRIEQACASSSRSGKPTLVAVSKIKPASDVRACYEHAEQRDFGENYVQELEEKAGALAELSDIRWHFIGTLQSNKAKNIALIPNLYSIQTLTSTKTATALNKHLPASRPPLNVFLQVNTSGEDSKSGLPPLSSSASPTDAEEELTALARHVVAACPRLRLQGLMTIGSLAESLHANADGENEDFERLRSTRDVLHRVLAREFPADADDGRGGRWGGEEGTLLLSMGMSSDFEAALKAGSDVVRVGTGIFGARPKKG